ncbi:hypothetical protein CVT24_012729 [Panaeolus cyanescens]|uniref:Uncharacterized protein n=1 Tax=Panaeolus cyanescens TaxID=181874 RepID=A0A409WKM6_9AGAR|nr:hypothetical protein CVT24_012729 [Panaeolus cyanescens]
MTNGPPPSAASSSKSSDDSNALTASQNVPVSGLTGTLPATTALPQNYNNAAWQGYWNQYAQYASTPYQRVTTGQPSTPSIQDAASNPYVAMYFPTNGQGQPMQSLSSQPHVYTTPKSTAITPVTNTYSIPTTANIKSPSPKSPTPPPPAPETYNHWDDVIKKFLDRAGMVQASKGLEKDMLVLNPIFEQDIIPNALRELSRDLQDIIAKMSGKQVEIDNDSMQVDETNQSNFTESSGQTQRLDERKLGYVKLSNGGTPQTQSSINKSISQFIARTRARNDASNNSEFLLSLAEKKRKLQEEGQEPVQFSSSSCARVDARTIDREKQMKYDIAKNEEGPLSRSRQKEADTAESSSGIAAGKQPSTTGSSRLGTTQAQDDEDAQMSNVTPARHPGLDERLNNIEAHLAVRYVPSPPRTLLARLKYVEDHINRLEKEYPPWAALHFNQPRRGWPPPPRATPIIVPPHLRAVTSDKTSSASTTPLTTAPTSTSSSTTPAPSIPIEGALPAAKKPKTKSSLHKAVLERLEVQKAMNEMNTKGNST